MKKALVIGGSSDIGSDVVQTLERAGYETVWTYFRTERPENPGQGILCDLRDLKQVEDLFEDLSGVDLLVLSAIPFIGSVFSFEQYMKMRPFQDAYVYVFTAARRVLKPGGRIISMLGQSAEKGFPSGEFYAATFAYLRNIGISMNVSSVDVSVCNFLLGPVDTRIWAEYPDEKERFLAKAGSFISSGEVAKAVLEYAAMEKLPMEVILNAY